MALGKRIEARLNELGWSRQDLMEKLPELTPQALSNLIVRDSKRSEWDEKLAEALGVDLIWLVYGKARETIDAPQAFAANERPAPYLVETTLPEEVQRLAQRIARLPSDLRPHIETALTGAEAIAQQRQAERGNGN